jgi:tRNA modification GTPase
VLLSDVFSTDDTIVAIATPPGRGGIGVVRISGPDAPRIAAELSGRRKPLEPRRATFARVAGAQGACDQVVLTSFPSPQSYTGQDVVEISAHGSPVLLRALVEAVISRGARLAEPGEFTLRAFLHGRMDLVQAEAVRDLVDAVTPLQARAAFDQLEGTLTARVREADARLFDLVARLEASLDFPEEGYHFIEGGRAAEELEAIVSFLDVLLGDAATGRLVREGAQVAIVGRPNTGKSSLFNALAGAERSIVTAVPGTTRDLVSETVDLEGLPVTLVDTAGVHSAPADEVEIEGITRAVATRDVAALVLLVLDLSQPLTDDDRAAIDATQGGQCVVAANKSDLHTVWDVATLGLERVVVVSAKTGAGLRHLRGALVETLTGRELLRDVPAITNVRHARLLARARAALARARAAASARTPEEFVLLDINEARECLESVTGARTADDLLHAIFSRFCVGK